MSVTPHRTLAAHELAQLAGTSVARLDAAVAVGLLTPGKDGRHPPGDVHRLRIVDAFADAGIPMAALATAQDQGALRLGSYDRLHPDPGTPSRRTYGELRQAQGERGPFLGSLLTALGLPEPGTRSRLAQADEDLLLRLLEVIADTGAPEHGLRIARLFSDGLRRTTHAVLDVYREAAERHSAEAGASRPAEDDARFMDPWDRYAQLAPELARWLTARHLSEAIDTFSVAASEQYLANLGILPPRDLAPPTVAFIDLAGFTRLSEEQNDEELARIALAFAQLAARLVDAHDGHVVKLLGDGVLVRFVDVAQAVEGTLRVLAELPMAGLPHAHAGIHRGPLIERDGDIFGRTVNLASRIADAARTDWLLASTDVAEAVGGAAFILEPVGAHTLAGMTEPVELVRISRATRGVGA